VTEPSTLLSDHNGPKRGLDRVEACKFLDEEYGLKRTPRTLAKEAVHGRGPRFYHVGRAVRMLPDDLRAWAEAKIGPRVSSTAELTAMKAEADISAAA
jgi:hypothetical protein